MNFKLIVTIEPTGHALFLPKIEALMAENIRERDSNV
jgi:hypothetical protein